MISLNEDTQYYGDVINPLIGMLKSRELEVEETANATISDDSSATRYGTNNVFLIIGIVLNSICALGCLLAIIFVAIFRNHRVLRMAQPFFLGVICIGSSLIASSGIYIEVNGFYYNTETSQRELNMMCMAFALTFFLGNIIVYMALFAKTWRLQKVTQFRRNQTVRIKHVLWPSILMEVAFVIVVGLWFGLDPPVWATRDWKDGSTTGYCQLGGENPVYIVLVFIMMGTSAILGLWMIRKIPASVPEELNDGKQIRTLYAVHFVIAAVFATATLVNRSFEIRDMTGVITVFVVFPFSLTNIALLIAPKCYAVWYERKHGASTTGIGRGTVTVRGVKNTIATAAAAANSIITSDAIDTSRIITTDAINTSPSNDVTTSTNGKKSFNGAYQIALSNTQDGDISSSVKTTECHPERNKESTNV